MWNGEDEMEGKVKWCEWIQNNEWKKRQIKTTLELCETDGKEKQLIMKLFNFLYTLMFSGYKYYYDIRKRECIFLLN